MPTEPPPEKPRTDEEAPSGESLATRIKASADRLRVKAHLMSMDARKRWDDELAPGIEGALADLGEAGKNASEKVRASSSELADTIGAFAASLETSSEQMREGLVEGQGLNGRKVLTSDARNIGDVVDVAFDPQTWTVETIGVRLSKEAAEELGVERKLWGSHVLRLPTTEVRAVGADSVILHLPWEALKRAR
jgi:sporulation protein YlmC with PRC-barrel domain